ncbi:hypothetical protein GXW82_12690 [Streptacidiphilus sp. 4-A2]|nr:hypothetical protein [Streptacidiphilus sp. 4-A2]
MWPIYQQETIAKPFVGRIPQTFADDMDTIDAYLAESRGTRDARPLVELLVRRRKETTAP